MCSSICALIFAGFNVRGFRGLSAIREVSSVKIQTSWIRIVWLARPQLPSRKGREPLRPPCMARSNHFISTFVDKRHILPLHYCRPRR